MVRGTTRHEVWIVAGRNGAALEDVAEGEVFEWFGLRQLRYLQRWVGDHLFISSLSIIVSLRLA